MKIICVFLLISSYSIAMGALGPSAQEERKTLGIIIDALSSAEPALRTLKVPYLDKALNDLKLATLKNQKTSIVEALQAPKDISLGLNLIRPVLAYATEVAHDNSQFSAHLGKVFPKVGEDFFTIAMEIEMETFDSFKEPRGCYRRDALRHSIWASVLTKKFGKFGALIVTTSHEINLDILQDPSRTLIDVDNNEILMDLANNIMSIYLSSKHPDWSYEKIKEVMLSRVQRGETLMLNPVDYDKPRPEKRIIRTIPFTFKETEFSKNYGC